MNPFVAWWYAKRYPRITYYDLLWEHIRYCDVCRKAWAMRVNGIDRPICGKKL